MSAPGFERRDVPARLPLWVAAATLVLLAGGMAGLGLLMQTVWGPEGAEARPPPPPVRPAPRLQSDPAADLAELRAVWHARLHAYGWVDRAAGVVHVPIEQAMSALAAGGLPEFAAPDPAEPREPAS